MESNEVSLNSKDHLISKSESENMKNKKMAYAYILGISGVSAALAGFITTHIAKKNARKHLKKLDNPNTITNAPYALAFKALGWGTLWAVGIFSLSMFAIALGFGIRNLDDLRTKIRKHTKKPIKSEERTEFENLSDFLNYLQENFSSDKAKKS